MTWLFAALWKLPASNSLTRMAEARECVYGSVAGPKRPRSKLSLSRCSYRRSVCSPLRPRPAVAKASHRDAFKIESACPFADSALPRGAACRIARADECPIGHRSQIGIEDVDKA